MELDDLSLGCRHTLRWTAVVAGLLALPLAKGVAQAAAPNAVLPGDDFFTYANQRWLDTTRLPAGRERWTARNEIEVTTRLQLTRLLDEAPNGAPGSVARQVGDFLTAYRDEAGIEARGLSAIRPLLDGIDQIRDKRALTSFLGQDIGADVDPRNWGVVRSRHILGLAVDAGIHGEPINRVFLVQGGLGLSDREQYLDTTPHAKALRAEYLGYITQLLVVVGVPDAERRAGAVLAFETAMARTQGSQAASLNDSNADNVWTRADFARRAPGMEWTTFFTAAGLGREESFVVWQPTAITGLAALVASQPLAVWQDYLKVRLLDRSADLLPRAIAGPALLLHGAAAGEPDTRSRAVRATAQVQVEMRDAIGQLYVERYFPVAEKVRLQTITRNVIAAFRARVTAVTWMTPRSRALAMAKLDSLKFEVAYPDHWPDRTGLRIDAHDARGNAHRLEARRYRATLARIGRPVDRKEWMMGAQRVGAVLNFQLNSYNFPAALLQAPKYDPAASDAANYGAIGAVIGHEASHFVDLLGADYDANGGMAPWWSAEDRAQFQAAADPLGRQVAAYAVAPGLAIDPKLTQTENVADLAGLSAAFDAYRATLSGRTVDPAELRQMDREFFIGFAGSWRGIIADGGMAKVLAGDTHAPERYRIAIVRNLDAWYSAFDVKPGQRLYLAPADRVRVW